MVRGLNQGFALPTVLFNLAKQNRETIIRNNKINSTGSTFNRTRQYLSYADNVEVILRLAKVIKEVVVQIQEVARKAGLVTINHEKLNI